MDGPGQTAENGIELRIEEISQLFDSLDPFPFRERGLDKEAEEFIVGWARELSLDRPIKIVVHLPEAQDLTPESQEIGPAITRYFGYRARMIMLDLRELLRLGWRSLVIGVAVLSFSMIVGQTLAANLAPLPIRRVIEESLLISGWVANWRPLQIFLYDWWPIVRRRNLYRRLLPTKRSAGPSTNSRSQIPNTRSGSWPERVE